MHTANNIPVTHEQDSSGAWRQAHARCLELAKRAAALDREIGRALLEAERERVFAYLGFAGIIEYGDRIFGLGPRVTLERLRVARELERLPALDAALAGGALCYSAVRELSRLAEPDTEAEWVAAAAGQSMRQIEELVNGRSPGDRPSDPARAETRRHVLRFEVTADVLALVRQAVGALRKTHRDQGRCRAPGCRGATFLDVHHVRARADGGGHDASNLAALCGFHHDAVHRGALAIEGDANAELVFRHADGTAYGAAPTPAALEVFTDAFVALRTMGWKEHEARAAVDAVRAHVGVGKPPSIEAVLRRCLAELRSPTRPAAAPSA